MSKKFSGWNEQRVRELKGSGKIRDYHIPKTEKVDGKMVAKHFQKRSKEKDWIGWNLLYWCNERCFGLREEFRFAEPRRWKFDWAIECIKVAVEYEGLFSEKSRHTTAKGFTGDTDKYNHAQALGWKVIRLTALNYKTMLQELNKLIA
jgi:hypothetical protein